MSKHDTHKTGAAGRRQTIARRQVRALKAGRVPSKKTGR